MSYKRVLANGVFDIFHHGHLLYLRHAASMGERLIVAVTRDAFVNKGPNRPTFPVEKRMDIIRELRCVDEVLAVDNGIQAFQIVKPDIWIKGRDYIGKLEHKHVDYCKAHGIHIAFADTPLMSATQIIRDRARLG